MHNKDVDFIQRQELFLEQLRQRVNLLNTMFYLLKDNIGHIDSGTMQYLERMSNEFDNIRQLLWQRMNEQQDIT
ncbi:MAG: hypothetical protein GF313_15630 [Caldithrix sp.]|nr:hypothetical protein [Caldithrix sp.]